MEEQKFVDLMTIINRYSNTEDDIPITPLVI